jgi:hypothetical protein
MGQNQRETNEAKAESYTILAEVISLFKNRVGDANARKSICEALGETTAALCF